MSTVENHSGGYSRRGFLSQAGKTLALGLGLAFIPGKALAESKETPLATSCCYTNCKLCPRGQEAYSCSGCNTRCCICVSNTQPQCFTTGCIC